MKTKHSPRVPAALALAATASGLAALVYEVLWVRQLGELLGNTATAIVAVLTVFFLGLGVGARILGARADRTAETGRLFAALELVIAASGILLPIALVGLERISDRLPLADAPAFVSLALALVTSLLVLIVPTLAMGGTIPVLIRHATRTSPDTLHAVGLLYGLNTVGGGAGVALAVFVLIPELGIRASFFSAAAINVLSALLVLTTRAAPDRRPERAAEPEAGPALPVAWVAFGTGFASIAFEVAWTRALASRFLSTVYSFATILLVYLVCLGLGSLFAARLSRRPRGVTPGLLARLLLGCGLAGLLSILWLGRVPASLAHGVDPTWALADRQWFEFRYALLVVSVPVLLFGVTFPILVRLAGDGRAHLGKRVGRVYLANTVGSVLAPVVVGFFAIPFLGTKWTIVLVSWLLLLLAVFGLLPAAGGARAGRRAWQGGALLLGALLTLALPKDLRLWRYTDQDRLIAYREGVSASIAVVREPDGTAFLKINNSYRLGDTRTRFAQQRQGLLPLLLHPDPADVLFLGIGTGSSVGAAAEFDSLSIDALEIIPEIESLLPHFTDINFDLSTRAMQDPKVELWVADAKHFVRNTTTRYDVVVGDLFVPWRAGEGSMYTREHLVAVSEALSPDGLFCQWLPLYQLRPDEFRIVVRTFCDVFDHVSAWWLYFNATDPAVALVASRSPLRLDGESLRARLSDPSRRALLTSTGLSSAGDVFGCWITGRDSLDAWSRRAPLETRDRPRIEFLAPRGRFGDLPARSAANVARLLRLGAPAETADAFAALSPADHRTALRYQRGMSNVVAARHYLARGFEPERVMAAYAAAFLDVPEAPWLAAILIEGVKETIRTGRPAAADLGIQALTAVDHTAAEGHYLAAERAVRDGDVAGALGSLREALRVAPEHEASWVLLRRLRNETDR